MYKAKDLLPVLEMTNFPTILENWFCCVVNFIWPQLLLCPNSEYPITTCMHQHSIIIIVMVTPGAVLMQNSWILINICSTTSYLRVFKSWYCDCKWCQDYVDLFVIMIADHLVQGPPLAFLLYKTRRFLSIYYFLLTWRSGIELPTCQLGIDLRVLGIKLLGIGKHYRKCPCGTTFLASNLSPGDSSSGQQEFSWVLLIENAEGIWLTNFGWP
jgi:hypothetical protein